ncbi:hypothetical protein Patl_1953 [Paraglaciecola sp. T6c]|uniref:hypothetical protein n=1 Tax=Pseudoalteromonas atlantica (strain T6c / ATCC BAA-1087) TaxID=3042615 RepID=UPI00005C60A4|nr:hypothetical protein [Paraglaciecola sp. T6c]ABG40471.1 hypothetical protein Patl_1953 [Paraglaciecola sp. T6c]
MIVTSFEYEKWQNEYAARANDVGKATRGDNTNQQTASASGQAFAAELAVQQSHEQSHQQSKQRDSITESNHVNEPQQGEPTFGDEAFEYLLANRLGVDKRTLDELKAELEALASERDNLIEKESLNEAQQQRLEVINERIDALTQLMQDLVEQASERTAEHEAQQALLSGFAQSNQNETKRSFGI